MAVPPLSRYHETVEEDSGNIGCPVSEVKPKLLLSLFGDFRASYCEKDVTPTRNAAVRLLLLLALGESASEARARICTLLWPDTEPKRARENLRQALFYLRGHFDNIGFEGWSISRTHVALDRAIVSSDADALLSQITEQRHVPQKLLQSPEIAETYLHAVVESSDSFNDWLAARRTDFQRSLHSALQKLLNHTETPAEQQKQCAELLLAHDPGDEVACRALMRLSVTRGDTVEALRRYNALWKYMGDEFDVEPSEQTQSLAVEIKLGKLVLDRSQHQENTASDSDAPTSQSVAATEATAGGTNQRQASLLLERDTTTRNATSPDNSGELLWSEISSHVAGKLLPEHHGRLINSDDNRILLSFATTRVAVEAALELQEFASTRFKPNNTEVSTITAPPLRIAVNVGGEIVYSESVSVPVAADLIGLASYGEIVTSVEVKDQIIHTLDANIEDLGDHGLANVEEPVRAYRLHPPQPEIPVSPTPLSEQKTRSLLPTIAIIPPTTYKAGDGMIGEILADEMIAVLSTAQEANIVSRLSSRIFQNRDCTAAEIGSRLQANFIVSGRYREFSGKLLLDLELTDARTEQVVWSERKSGTVTEFLSPEHDLIMPLTANIIAAVMNFELQQALDAPMPTLESYTLLVSAITLMNQLSVHAFDRSKQMLEHLIERVPHHAEPYAWLGKWHVLRVQQGWSSQTEIEAQVALQATERALELNPNSSLAHTIRGFIYTNLLRRLDDGENSYRHALQSNPNQSLAWLLKGCLHAFRGEGTPAYEHALHAIRLTPLDPLRYFYDSLAGTAALSAHRFEDAHEFAKRSLMVNRTHTSTLRLLAVAQWNLDMQEEAKNTGDELLRLEPSFSVNSWIERTPSAGYKIGDEWARTLKQIGLPD